MGSGYMPRGNSDASYGQSDNSPYGFQLSSYTTYRSDFTHVRTLTLSNGSIIWDFAGNLWQHVQRSTMNHGDLTTTIASPTCSSGTPGTGEYCQYGNSTNPYITTYNDSSFSATTIGPSNSSWDSNQGIGMVDGYDGSLYGSVFWRGGGWNRSANDGIEALNLVYTANAANSMAGFRCAR